MSVEPKRKLYEEDCDKSVAKKHKNDKATLARTNNLRTLFLNAQNALNKKNEEFIGDNGRSNIEKITTTFQALRDMIDRYEKKLIKQILVVEKKNEATKEKCRKSISTKQVLLSRENEKFEKLVSVGHNDQLKQDKARFESFLQQFIRELSVLKSPKKNDYIIDEIDELKGKIKDALNGTCVTELASSSEKYSFSSDCGGRRCIKCGQCRDWYYSGDEETWEWIQSIDEWDKEERDRWVIGKYEKRFKRREGSTCNAYYGYYYDRNRQYHGPHIYLNCGRYYALCYNTVYGDEICCGTRVNSVYERETYDFFFLRYIINKINTISNYQLRFLCFHVLNAHDHMIDILQTMIQFEQLLLDYTIKRVLNYNYVEWK